MTGERCVITEDEYNETLDKMTEEEHSMEDDDPKKFIAGQGGEAIKELLKRVQLEEEIARLRAELKDDPSALKKAENIKRHQSS